MTKEEKIIIKDTKVNFIQTHKTEQQVLYDLRPFKENLVSKAQQELLEKILGLKKIAIKSKKEPYTDYYYIKVDDIISKYKKGDR